MENLPFIILLSIAFVAVCLMFFYIKTLKRRFLQKIVSRKFIDKDIYSSLIIDDICCYLLKVNKYNYYEMMQSLQKNNLSKFYKLIQNKNIKQKIDIFNKKISKEFWQDIVYLLSLAKYYISENDFDKAYEILQNIKTRKMSKKQQACFRYLMAKISVYEGDLFVATEDLNLCLKIFKKKNMLFEEAETYFSLGTIYRISGIYDTAELMYRTALNIYADLFSNKCEAETLGTLGLLMSVQNRFEEAHDYFEKAEYKAHCNKNLKCFILSQKAMLELIEGHSKKAIAIVQKTLPISKNAMVKANLYDVLARIKLFEKKYKSSSDASSQAFNVFLKNKNYSAAFESLYIKAIALFRGKKFEESEKTLRYLIKIEKDYKHCFHVAGAYTLLGLILLENKYPDRAKAMFNKALSQELCNERKIGAAIDYANLAIVEKMQGNRDEALKNLQKALNYEQDIDEKVINEIKSILN